MPRLRHQNAKGFNLIEVVIATLVLSIVVAGLYQIQYFMSKQSVAIKDKTFANQKAIQILEELRVLVTGSEKTDVSVLDDFDDGSQYKTVLTSDGAVTDPGAAISGNVAACNGWKYLRQITVAKLAEEPFARKVYVRIYRAKCPYDGQPAERLAETLSVLKTIKSEYVPTQVMDVYIISLENVPGWWSSLSTMRPIFNSVIDDLQTRNPGLELRAHWITRLSYGRDQEYVPYINSSTRTNVAVMPHVYFYPGLTQQSDGSDFNFYDPDLISGRINIDNTLTNASSYVLCDQVNHAVRYPEEEAIYNVAVASAAAAGAATPEISLRMLLEKLNDASKPLKNILLVNLHGELLPIPPVRNYSDPAKDPTNNPNYRVVTHPDQLQYNTGNAVRLRVYPYMISPDSYAATLSLSTMTILFPSDNINSSAVTIERIDGNSGTAYSKAVLPSGSPYYSVTHPDSSSTLITLYSTPMRHPANATKGLDAAKRVYGLEYIPAPTHAAGTVSFSYDLNYAATAYKNTARWIIYISSGALADGRHSFETRIGTDTAAGTMSNKPANLSKSYVWINSTPPITEQYQFMGDPRHMPYKDVKANHGYNWYFKQIAASDIADFSKTANGWGGDANDIDVPRFFYIYRRGLLNSQAIWSAMNGFSYYYVGKGGEFGSDMAPLPNALPFVKTPWSTTTDASIVAVDEILNYCNGSPNEITSRVVAKTDNSWYAKYWLGELYPDAAYAVWQSSGNLPTGTGNYYRAKFSNTSLTSEWGSRDRTARTASTGCSSFFNGKTSSGTGPFKHYSTSATGALTTLGTDLSSMFNFPLIASVTTPRPFTLNYGSDYPSEWSDTIYSGIRTTLSVPAISSVNRIYYTSSYTPASYYASSVVKMTQGSDTAYFSVSGLGTQSDFGSGPMGKFVVLSMMRAFMDGGLYTGQDKITQIPLVQISSPTLADEFINPSNINVAWSAGWTRWDSQAYTEEYSSGYTDSTTLSYQLKYSADNGRTWRFCSDGTAASAGVRDAAHAIGITSYTWNVSLLPRGSYILRLEAYRGSIDLHYSYDQLQVYINR